MPPFLVVDVVISVTLGRDEACAILDNREISAQSSFRSPDFRTVSVSIRVFVKDTVSSAGKFHGGLAVLESQSRSVSLCAAAPSVVSQNLGETGLVRTVSEWAVIGQA